MKYTLIYLKLLNFFNIIIFLIIVHKEIIKVKKN
jgi:hypothetical protein